MKAEDKIAKETDDNIKRVYRNCELLMKYFDLLDKRLIRNKVEKRIIQPYMDLEDIIEDEIMAYLQFIVDQRQGALSQLVINVVEKFLLRIAQNKENYPSENEMESIINQIGKDYNYNSNKLLSEIFADYLRIEKYSQIFKQINDKLGIIIFNQKNVFRDYILKMLYVEDIFSEEEASDCENQVLGILKKHNNYFNIPEKFLNNLDTISAYLSTCDIKNFHSEIKKNNELKNMEENIQEKEEKDIKIDELKNMEENIQEKEEKDIKIVNEIILEQQDKIKGEDSNNEIGELRKELKNLEINFKEEMANHNTEIKKMNGEIAQLKEKNIIFGDNQIHLKRRIDNLEDKLFQIQSRDILKKIVNYNLYHLQIDKILYHLQIDKIGDYDERIQNIIFKLRSYKNSDLYIRFFQDIKTIINKGDSLAHTFEKKLPYGMNKSYLDLLLNNLSLPSISFSEKKTVKKILINIKTEDMIKRFLTGLQIIDKNEKFDLKKILADL